MATTPAKTDTRTRFPWVKLDRLFLEGQASNARLPEWQRVALAGWAKLNPKGNALFKDGELEWRTAPNHTTGNESRLRVDPKTGELLPHLRTGRAINEAANRGWISKGSTSQRITAYGIASVGNLYGTLPWMKLHREFIEAQCTASNLPEWQRLWFAALAHLGPSGHAHFKGDELARLTGIGNMRRALADAKREGWIDEDSSVHCIGIPSNVAHVGYDSVPGVLAA